MNRHVVVIGAGIVGVSAAIWLRRAGAEVTLVDRAEPGRGTSHGNGGVLAAAGVAPMAKTPAQTAVRTKAGISRRMGGSKCDVGSPCQA